MKNRHVLQIEDDEDDIFLLQHAFKTAGLNSALCVTRNGKQAMDYLSGQGDYGDRQKHPMPCLILLDLKLPHKDGGMEFLQWLRQTPELATLPVIVFTSSSQQDDIARSYKLGANAYVIKPSDTQRRLEFAKLIKSFWLELNEPPVLKPG